MMNEHEALVWCLKNGVKAVTYSVTGYWVHQDGGSEIMPPVEIHAALDRARTEALRPAPSASPGQT